ncbi:hypothetical protein IFHNHDMJ_01684 [Synechococcus sp. CBW1107]|nr:hypothetical protein IFHNHDMJ_01684 [Synechococcus sp. CBW1107]
MRRSASTIISSVRECCLVSPWLYLRIFEQHPRMFRRKRDQFRARPRSGKRNGLLLDPLPQLRAKTAAGHQVHPGAQQVFQGQLVRSMYCSELLCSPAAPWITEPKTRRSRPPWAAGSARSWGANCLSRSCVDGWLGSMAPLHSQPESLAQAEETAKAQIGVGSDRPPSAPATSDWWANCLGGCEGRARLTPFPTSGTPPAERLPQSS